MTSTRLTDAFGRQITYLRLSVTDRCDYRCVYCMAEDMVFLPRAQVLSLEESIEICQAFAELGVTKIRITGGEPLVRNGIQTLFSEVGAVDSLRELTLTTNGSRLSRFAPELAAAGVKRINVSLDTLDSAQFTELTRFGKMEDVLQGIEDAKAAGIERIKLNAVILRNRNLDQVLPLVNYALDHQLDISFIEEMPLGEVTHHGREDEFCSSAELRELIATQHSLTPSDYQTGGPSRYWQVAGSDSQIGFISPHSDNFCSSCNRVRVTAEGKLLLCLGNENSVDLKAVIRRHPGDRERLKQTIVDAMSNKPEKHYFYEDDAPQIVRFMNTTGG
ncbi:GTP 3',8-cyclase MoaA [Pseudomaricurvus alkylphenolicus]|uniref:GTP 3',8-cyclase MoaA n=1 Tax=Pseudomaricurvus alkylphenolicus TaxID=1306991 RepID=UPI001420C89D|nr:GTP 3',8-cyclase MoaA [Pseudomaricurvus alkylphenolicus]NIB41483.1 GTP 3',8-cyclase MoaA [Pseudomaricurvus alkylphenolicus]